MMYRKLRIKKIFIFPLILLLLLIILTTLKVSGTSIGIYHEYLYGDTRKDPNLIYGKPQTIRSDEWLVNTQLTIAQEKNGYKHINKNFNSDKDMSILADSPYLEWSALFRPQNFAFFILPLEYAFAFKWWFILFSLMLGVYFFSLKILTGKITIAILSSIIIGFSPFISWWYLTGTISTLCYGFLILLISMSIIDQKKLFIGKRVLSKTATTSVRILLLAYLLISFGLLLYPPFQIPVVIVVFFFVLGYLISHKYKKGKKNVLAVLLAFSISAAIAVTSLSIFLINRSEIIQIVNNTAYPGKRIAEPGGYDIKKLLTTYLQPQLQREDRGKNYDKNQSESSNFIVLPIFFILPAIGLLAWIYFKKGRFEWILFLLIVTSLIFVAHLFIPGTDLLSRIFFLQMVPNYRLLIGMGMLAIILVLYMLKVLNEQNLQVTVILKMVLILYSVVFFCFMIWAGLEIASQYPKFVSSKKLIFLFAGIVTFGMTLILLNKPRIGLLILAAFSIYSVLNVNPLYIGLGPLYNSDITKTISDISPTNSTWAAAQDLMIENVPQMSGRYAVTGLSTYPNIEFWEKYSSEHKSSVYNRYAHIVLSSNDTKSLVLATPDLMTVSSSCKRKIAEKIEYIISTTPLPESCNHLIKKLNYPKITFYYYRQ